ncbi:S46 family peptidase [Roseiterribacter gracilis]|uniref:Dipeptidyl-peptidase n=1 Tax=Roseiterribacter gracilis TaxID=2812848 RepID=A0A8S8X9Q2_9PROT|nr:dipeptidyl-peptidase [Rhodospirillales bacterium TMPK1]
MLRLRLASAFALATVALCATSAHADPGMFTFNNFPSAKVGEKYGFTPSQSWLDRVRLAAVKVGNGCSGGFVSQEGLVITNHHCARSCVEHLSTKEKDLMATGFVAADRAAEKKCPQLEVTQLIEMTDVTDKIAKAVEGKTGAELAAAQRAAQAALEKECSTAADIKCNVVTLYQGGRYELQKNKRYADVRLVLAPEAAIAFFGGDPDNYEFPRYDVDMTLLRAYENDKPAATAIYFPLAKTGPAEDELTFAVGTPGVTQRGLTLAQLELQRDVLLPQLVAHLAEKRGILREYARRGAEPQRTAEQVLFGVENLLKRASGQYRTLIRTTLLEEKRKDEAQFRSKADDEAAKAALDQVADVVRKQESLHRRFAILEGVQGITGFEGELFSYARKLVRAAEERPKPNAERLAEYSDTGFVATERQILDTIPIARELEVERLAWSLSKIREWLSPDDPVVRALFGKEQPEEVAKKLVTGTKLADPAVRAALLKGGKAAIDASNDPMIRFVVLADPYSRAARKEYDSNVTAPLRRLHAQIATARFKLEGTSVPPDATGTLRLSYGAVKGWMEDGKQVPAFTNIKGLYERATGNEPFKLPAGWLAAKNALDPNAHMNVAIALDTVGGSSGSPIINKQAQLVALNFDGNKYGTGGTFGNIEALNRSVGVDAAALRAAIGTVYKAPHILREMDAPQPGG